MSDDYRDAFQAAKRVSEYEHELFGAGTYGNFLWSIEKEWLDSFLLRWPGPLQSVGSYLDFACGTGRVLAYVEDKVQSATGVDVSRAMLDLARAKVQRATLIEADITREPERLPESQYQLITAFRFILNAQPDLRLAGLTALARLLNGPDARLIVTLQARVPSYRSLQRRSRDAGSRNFMTDKAVNAVLSEAGLSCVESITYDFLSGRALTVIGAHRLRRIERASGRLPLIQKFGAHRLLVLKAEAERAADS